MIYVTVTVRLLGLIQILIYVTFSGPLTLEEVSIQLSSCGLVAVNKLLIDTWHILPLCQNNTKTTWNLIPQDFSLGLLYFLFWSLFQKRLCLEVNPLITLHCQKQNIDHWSQKGASIKFGVSASLVASVFPRHFPRESGLSGQDETLEYGSLPYLCLCLCADCYGLLEHIRGHDFPPCACVS